MRLLVTGGSGFIGTHLARRAEAEGVDWVNVDHKAPVSGEHADRWVDLDLRHGDRLAAEVDRFQPTHILHLAARTDIESTCVGDYESNTLGSLNLIRTAARAPLERLVFTSTQFVVRPGAAELSDTYYDPHTAYGISKVAGELMVRAAMDPELWVIVRPTLIWGPWHPYYHREFWKVLDRGLYAHPGGREVVRTYGYVSTVVDQLWSALSLEREKVTGEVFYLGDPPIELSRWVDAFARALTGRDARRAPRPLLRAAAAAGDAARLARVRLPLTTSRYRSMTQDYVKPVQKAIDVLGSGSVSLEQGVAESVAWYRSVTTSR